MGTHHPQIRPWPLIIAVELGKNRGLAIGNERHVLLKGELGIMAPYLGQGAVPPCIPLLAVQADLDALAQKEHGPH